MAESVLIGLTLVVMIGVLIVSLMPFVPGPLLMWLVAVVFAYLNGFDRVSLVAVAIMTAIMLAGSTTDIWMPVLGMRAQGASCLGALGTLIGGIIGTFVVPIPICGTLIGAVGGALLFEMIHAGDARRAFYAGKSAMQTFLLGLAVEITATLLIFATFAISLLLTR